MDIDKILKWIHDMPFAEVIRTNDLLFNMIECTHVVAITLVIGSIAIIDLRLLGFASLDRAITRLSKDVLPITWISFVVAVITGLLMFSSNAVQYAHNFYFQTKMILIVLAGINMMIFEFVVARGIHRWDTTVRTPKAAKVAGALSLIFWISVVWFGRQIGFSLG